MKSIFIEPNAFFPGKILTKFLEIVFVFFYQNYATKFWRAETVDTKNQLSCFPKALSEHFAIMPFKLVKNLKHKDLKNFLMLISK